MVQLAQAEFLWLLLLIPLVFVIYGIYLRRRKKLVSEFGDNELVSGLMPSYSSSKGWLKVSFLAVAIFFFVLGLCRPRVGAKVKEVERKGAEIIIALDVSNSMLAQDYTPNRLERAKLAVSKLVDRLDRDRVGLIVFAGDAFVQLPVTTDFVSAKLFLNSISTGSVPKQGTALGQAIITAIRSFSLDTPKSRALILITDGENHEDDAVSAAKEAAGQTIKVYCVGIGSENGKPIPMADGSLLKDEEGNTVVTKLDEKTLMEVAQAGEGMYVRADNADFGLDKIIDELRSMEGEQFKAVVFEEFNEQYMYFFAIALFFFVLEMLIGERKGKKFRGFEIFD